MTTLSDPDLPGHENRFKNGLRMEIETKKVRMKKQFDLIASIRFGVEQVSIRYGKAEFAIKKAKLTVNLTNGEVPLKNINLDKKLETEEEIKVKQEEAEEGNIGINVGWKNSGINASCKKISKNGQEYVVKEYLVKTEGGLTDPTWIFTTKTNNDILEGLLQKKSLATVNITKNPCELNITFEIENPEDICLVNGEIFNFKDLEKKRAAIIERKIAHKFLDKVIKQKPYLSKAELKV